MTDSNERRALEAIGASLTDDQQDLLRAMSKGAAADLEWSPMRESRVLAELEALGLIKPKPN